MCYRRIRLGTEDLGAWRRETAQERVVFLEKELSQPHLDGWIGLGQIRHSRQRDSKRKHRKDKSVWTCLQIWVFLLSACRKDAGGPAFCAHTDFQLAPQFFIPTLGVPGVAKSGAFLVPRVKLSPFWAASSTHSSLGGRSLCSVTSIPLLQLLSIWQELLEISLSLMTSLLFSLTLGFNVPPPTFILMGSLKGVR